MYSIQLPTPNLRLPNICLNDLKLAKKKMKNII